MKTKKAKLMIALSIAGGEDGSRTLCAYIGLYGYLGRSCVVSMRINVYLCYIFDPRNDPPYGI